MRILNVSRFAIMLLLAFVVQNLTAQTPILTYRRGNEAIVERVSLSPDSKYAITTDGNKEAVLWQVSSGNEIKRFTGIDAAAFSSNTEIVFVLSDKRKTVKTDLSGSIITTYPAQKDYKEYSNMLWSLQPADNVIISGNRIYYISTGSYTEIPNTLSVDPTSLYSPALRALVNGGSGGVVSVYDEADGRLKDTIRFKADNTDDCLWAGVSEDGKRAGVIQQYNLYVKEVATKKNVFSLSSTQSRFFVSAAFLDTDKLLVLDEAALTLYSLTTGKSLWKRKHTLAFASYGANRGFINISNDKTKIVTGSGYQKTMMVLNAAGGDSIQSLVSPSFGNRLSMVPEYADNLLSLVGEGKVLKLNLKSGMLEDNSNPGFFTGGGMLVYKENSIYFGNHSLLKAYNINNKNQYLPLFQLEVKNDISEVRVSRDKKFIMVSAGTTSSDAAPCDKNVLYTFNDKGQKLWQSNCEYLYGIGTAHTKNIMAMGYGADGANLYIRDIETGTILKNIKAQYLPYSPWSTTFSPNDRYVLGANNSRYEMFDLEGGTSAFVGKDLPDGKALSAYAFSPDEKKLAIGSFGGNVYFYDITAQKISTETILKNSSGLVNDIKYSEKGDFLFVSTADNTIKVWDLQTNSLAATIYTNVTGKEFMVVGANGRFDGKGSDFSSLYYVKGVNVIPITSTFETFYTPGLLSRILNREKFDPIPVSVFDIHPQPLVSIAFADGDKRNLEVSDDEESYRSETGTAEITVNATAPEDEVSEIRLFHNGKALNLTARNLFVADASGTDTKKYTVSLLPGTNRLRAIALNNQRTESIPKEITITYAVKTAQPVSVNPVVNNPSKMAVVDKAATLHLVVVGINKYQNEKLSLNYALADATAFKTAVEQDAKTILTNVKTYFVTDADANKKGITDALTAVQNTAKPQDVFVFYYAGHGVIGKNKEFYLVPTDVADLKNVDAQLLEKGIPSKLLQSYAVDIPAQKQLFILDACQSAGAFEAMMAADGDQQKSLAVVARSTGTHWMAASGAQQFANEFASLGHGVFTYVLLQALKGDAALNKMITVNGLKNFLQVQVPELMKKYNGAAQYPASYGYGSDFPVEVIP